MTITALCLARAASAQHCQPSFGPSQSGLSLSARLGIESAGYERDGAEGRWTGAIAELSAAFGRWHGRTWLGAYALARDGLEARGIGDLGGEARVSALRSADGSVEVGPALALTVPTANAAVGLGMGHVMAMPAVWAHWSREGLTAGGTLGYARALGGNGHEPHASHAPASTGSPSIVDPMNAAEVMAHGRVGWSLREFLRADATLSWASPLGVPGQTRVIAGVGMVASRGAFSLEAAVQLPLVGDPFRQRVLFSGSVRY